MQKDILDKLYGSFDLKARPGQGGKTFKYVPSDDIVDRMNKVFSGDWSTEVVEKEVIEDQILIRVRVYVKDPSMADSGLYWHEGYASQAIARFTQGVKSGQIIDIGNSYKSAMSKAIKTAVAKWGVGLYLEETSGDEEYSSAPFNMPNITTSTPHTKSVEVPKFEAPGDPFSIPVQTPVPETVPVAEPINIPPDTLNGGGMPKVNNDIPVPPNAAANPAPVFTDNNVVVTKAETPVDFNPPVDSVPKQDIIEKLTDVQKAAIDNIMSVHGKTFAELLSAALQRTDNLPASIEALTYQDAVKLIQYGNNLNTNQ